MAKIIVCDTIADSAVQGLLDAGIEVDVKDSITLDELAEVIGEYDGMIVRSRTKVREALIDKASKLKVIIRGGVGLDSIDVAYAQNKGIDVRNTPTASTNAVAELVIGMMFGASRHIARADASMKAGGWEKKKLKGVELAGKTLGVIGYGRIGQLVGEKGKALGMKVVAYDPFVAHEDIISLDELCKVADYITLHLPHTPDTHNIVGAGQFALMKPKTYIIQASRGGTVDEAALLNALTNGKLAGAALDVFTEEPPKSDALRQLVELPQVVVTPHIGASTVEAQGRIGEEIVEIAKSYFGA